MNVPPATSGKASTVRKSALPPAITLVPIWNRKQHACTTAAQLARASMAWQSSFCSGQELDRLRVQMEMMLFAKVRYDVRANAVPAPVLRKHLPQAMEPDFECHWAVIATNVD